MKTLDEIPTFFLMLLIFFFQSIFIFSHFFKKTYRKSLKIVLESRKQIKGGGGILYLLIASNLRQ